MTIGVAIVQANLPEILVNPSGGFAMGSTSTVMVVPAKSARGIIGVYHVNLRIIVCQLVRQRKIDLSRVLNRAVVLPV